MMFKRVLVYIQECFYNYNFLFFLFITILIVIYKSFCFSGFPLDNVKNFSDKDLRLATDNYHPSKKLGRGGFGTVYQVFRSQTLV